MSSWYFGRVYVPWVEVRQWDRRRNLNFILWAFEGRREHLYYISVGGGGGKSVTIKRWTIVKEEKLIPLVVERSLITMNITRAGLLAAVVASTV